MAEQQKFQVGAHVKWKWMGGFVEGEILEIYHKPTSKVIKGKKIKRNGSEEKPAFLVKSKAGNLALKLITELHTNNSTRKKYDGSLF